MTIVDLAEPVHEVVPYGAPGYDALADLWSRLVRPFDVTRTVAAITGLSLSVVNHQIGMALASSPEAERLLDEMPRTIRSLATSLATQHERCKGELRGPVLWSETMSARASSFGDDDLFVCATPSRVYDIDENRVLVAALVAVRDAAIAATEQTLRREQDSTLFRTVKRNGSDAGRFAEHPSLQRVSRQQPSGRALRRTRAGKKSKVYEPALHLLARAANPMGEADVRGWCDRRTRAQHAAFLGLVARLEQAGLPRASIRADHGTLVAGPVAYRHGRLLGDFRSPAGITAGRLLVDVPDDLSDPDRERATERLEARAAGREVLVVCGPDDLDRAAERVLAASS